MVITQSFQTNNSTFYRESPWNLDSRTLSRETLSRWTGRNSKFSNRYAPVAGDEARDKISHTRNLLYTRETVVSGYLLVTRCRYQIQENTLHTRNHKSEIRLEKTTESPLDNSSKNPLDK